MNTSKMNCLGRLTAVVAVVGLLHLLAADAGFASEPRVALNADTVKQEVSLLGPGAKVKVQLTDGRKLNGTIEEIEDGNFRMTSKSTSSTSIAYDEVARLKFAKPTYNANGGTVDALLARRVIVGLGLGKHIVVKTAAGKEYHGNIQTFTAEGFTILPDHQGTPVVISYGDVRSTGPNMSRGTKILIVVAVVAVVVVGVVVATKPWRSE